MSGMLLVIFIFLVFGAILTGSGIKNDSPRASGFGMILLMIAALMIIGALLFSAAGYPWGCDPNNYYDGKVCE